MRSRNEDFDDDIEIKAKGVENRKMDPTKSERRTFGFRFFWSEAEGERVRDTVGEENGSNGPKVLSKQNWKIIFILNVLAKQLCIVQKYWK